VPAGELVCLAALGEALARKLRNRLERLEARLAELVPAGHEEVVLGEYRQ
jgi:hypothetical protein